VFAVDYTLIGIGAKLQEQLDEHFGGKVDHIVSSETVGAKVGEQLKIDGALSMLYAIGFIFLFVMVRFDLRFAPGGIVALTHDAIIVTGAFALTWKEFNLQTIAALLTIIGYSINDTIVVFDRVRERVALNRDAEIGETTNLALNETLSRTVLTSGTTMLVVLATWVLGSGPIKDFAFALFVGIIVGTYSSLYVASPVFLWVNERFYRGKGHLLMAEKTEREGTGTLLGSPSPEEVGEDGRSEADRRGAAEDAIDAEAEEAAPGEKKTRRRRRRRPGAGS
jgi:preprotein translocase subunit SecF